MGPPNFGKTNSISQPKLTTIGAPGDKYEQEADRVAEQVVNKLHAPSKLNNASSIQRQDLPEEKELMMGTSIKRAC